MKFLYSFVLVLFITLTSCQDAFETVIELDPPQYEPAIVLRSDVAIGSKTITFSVSRNYGVLEDPFNNTDNYLLNDAKLVFSVNGTPYPATVVTSQQNSYNNFEVQLPEYIAAGDLLLCTVSNPGFQDIVARTQVPLTTTINNVRFVENGGLDQSGDERSKLVIDFDDPPGRNFYLIDVEIKDFNSNFSTTYISSIDPSVSESHRYYSLLVEDSSFDGKSKQLDIQFYRIDESRALGNIKLRWRSVSEDFYKYSRTLLNYQNSKDNPFASPVNVFSNVQNGLGLLSAYNEQVIIVE